MTSESAPTLILTPVSAPGRKEMVRHIHLTYTQKVGRSVPQKAMPAADNVIFDSKVLSRTHAEIWYNDGKVYIKDTKSSNGTFVNDVRLSISGAESEPYELKNGDKLKLGVDVLENNTRAHKCVLLDVRIDMPKSEQAEEKEDDFPAKATHIPLETLQSQGPEALVTEIDRLREESVKYHRQVAQLNAQLHTAFANEQKLKTALAQLTEILASLEDNANKRQDDMFHEDKLLAKIELMEKQLQFYMTRSASAITDDASRIAELKGDLQRAQEEHHVSAMKAKESIGKLVQEKHACMRQLQDNEREKRAIEDRYNVEIQRLKDAITARQAVERELNASITTCNKANEDLLRRVKELEASAAPAPTDPSPDDANAHPEAAPNPLHATQHRGDEEEGDPLLRGEDSLLLGTSELAERVLHDEPAGAAAPVAVSEDSAATVDSLLVYAEAAKGVASATAGAMGHSLVGTVLGHSDTISADERDLELLRQVAALREEKQKLEDDNKALTERIAALDAALAAAKLALEERIRGLESANADLLKQLDASTKSLDSVEGELSEKAIKIEALESERVAQQESAAAEAAAARKALQAVEEQLRAARAEATQRVSLEEAARKELARATEEKALAEERARAKAAEVASLAERMRVQLDERAQEARTSKEKNADLEAEVMRLARQAEVAASQAAEAKDAVKAKQQEIEQLTADLEAAKKTAAAAAASLPFHWSIQIGAGVLAFVLAVILGKLGYV